MHLLKISNIMGNYSIEGSNSLLIPYIQVKYPANTASLYFLRTWLNNDMEGKEITLLVEANLRWINVPVEGEFKTRSHRYSSY